jgi:hypothetical protein
MSPSAMPTTQSAIRSSFSKDAEGSKGSKLIFFHHALFLPHCPFEKRMNDYQGRRA